MDDIGDSARAALAMYHKRLDDCLMHQEQANLIAARIGTERAQDGKRWEGRRDGAYYEFHAERAQIAAYRADEWLRIAEMLAADEWSKLMGERAA